MDELTQLLMQRAMANKPQGPAMPTPLPTGGGVSPYDKREDMALNQQAPRGYSIRPMQPRDVGGIEAMDHLMGSQELQKAGAYPKGTYDANALTPQQHNEAWDRGLSRSGDLMSDDLRKVMELMKSGQDPYARFFPPKR
jgi:hypothetical protein